MRTKKFINYSSMLSLTDNYSNEQLDEIIAEYKNEQRKHAKIHSSSASDHDFFKRNVDELKKIKANRKRIKIAKEFVLKEHHIHLLNEMCFDVNDANVLYGTLPNALGIVAFNQDGDYFEEDRKRLILIIQELQYAIKELIKNALNTL